ncbi:hypothetical protein [Lysobacter sp. ISL-54]|uniref:hypothetical protein n=1 Tax=Lysobacter sp. ISL-54 TaxID=2819155 RepID=UPI0020362DBD|nr:hypothetical protein [Lysobacter sp. ISL-54]
MDAVNPPCALFAIANRNGKRAVGTQSSWPTKPFSSSKRWPIHPDQEPTPACYERYGFRMTPMRADLAHHDGERIKLDLFYQQRYGASVEATYWSRATIEAALRLGGNGIGRPRGSSAETPRMSQSSTSPAGIKPAAIRFRIRWHGYGSISLKYAG